MTRAEHVEVLRAFVGNIFFRGVRRRPHVVSGLLLERAIAAAWAGRN